MLTASNVLSYGACPRIVYLDLHGDSGSRRKSSEFLVMLGEDGRRHETEIAKSLAAHRVGFDRNDIHGSVARTIEALQDGLPRVSAAGLAEIDAERNVLRLGITDMLERVPGSSRLGDFHYEVVEIKKASRVKPAYRMQVAFYSDLLAGIQGVAPVRGHLILSDGRRETFDLAPFMTRYQSLLRTLREIESGMEPPVFICSQCGTCAWQGVCLPVAEEQHHLSLVFGLPRELAETLRAKGVHTYQALAALPPARLAAWGRCGEVRARRYIGQARSLTLDGVVWRRDPKLRHVGTEIFFDIEGDPENGVLYLFGVLVRENGIETYRPFLAERPGSEKQAFLECVEFLERWPEAPIYHYHHYERTVLDRLIERHGADPARVARLAERLRDLSGAVTETCFLPVRSYSLKAVARYLGFEWSQSNSSAVQSVVWFTSWQRTGDRTHLDQAVAYNEDDCRATLVLKDWLADGPHGVIESEEDALVASAGDGI
jgi:uncharacterized protein